MHFHELPSLSPKEAYVTGVASLCSPTFLDCHLHRLTPLHCYTQTDTLPPSSADTHTEPRTDNLEALFTSIRGPHCSSFNPTSELHTSKDPFILHSGEVSYTEVRTINIFFVKSIVILDLFLFHSRIHLLNYLNSITLLLKLYHRDLRVTGENLLWFLRIFWHSLNEFPATKLAYSISTVYIVGSSVLLFFCK